MAARPSTATLTIPAAAREEVLAVVSSAIGSRSWWAITGSSCRSASCCGAGASSILAMGTDEQELDGHIKAYKRLITALTIATDAFCSWDPSLERLPDQSPKIPGPDLFKLDSDRFTLAQFTSLCTELRQNPAILQYFPPLTMLIQRWGILIPLDPNIPALPLHAAAAVLPDARPHDFKVTYSMIEPWATIAVTISPGASKEVCPSRV